MIKKLLKLFVKQRKISVPEKDPDEKIDDVTKPAPIEPIKPKPIPVDPPIVKPEVKKTVTKKAVKQNKKKK